MAFLLPVPMTKRHLLLAAGLFLLTAIFSTGHHQGDEHFQILEFAMYKLGYASVSDLPWEFEERMRPALQPALAYLAYRVVGLGGEANPFVLSFCLRLLSGGFTLLVAYLLYRRYAPRLSGKPLRWFVLLLLFHWCAYYNGVRFSSENWSGLTVICGFLAYPMTDWREERSFTPAGGRSAWLAGALFGLAFLFRYQVALLVVGFGLWLLFVRREHWQRIIQVVGGGVLTVALAYPLTYWLYGEWTFPAWNYLASNLIEGKAATYGTRPWWGYFELTLLRGIPPLGLVYILATLLFCWHYRRDPLTLMVAVFAVVHSILARKDIRFLFPLIPLLPVLIAGSVKWTADSQYFANSKIKQKKGKFWLSKFLLLCWVVNVLLLASVIVRTAHSGIAPSKFIYEHYPTATLAGPNARMIVAEGAIARYYNRPAYVVDTAFSDVLGTRVPAPPTTGAPRLYLLNASGVPAPPHGTTLVYSNRPEWIASLDFFGWQDRQRWWYVYEWR